MRIIGPEDVAGKLSWSMVADAIEAGHRRAKPEIGDQFLHRGADTLLSRSAWIDGLGIGVKSMAAYPGNGAKRLPSIHGAMVLFDDATGQVSAVIDGRLMTYWKTAGDSVLGARLLARPDSRRLLIIGAGVVAESLARAYGEIFPALEEIAFWNRSAERAEALAQKLRSEGAPAVCAADLPHAAGRADMICTATLSKTPVLCGDWVSPGAHVDMIGAFTADMREGDDALLLKSRLFVDSRETTIDHIGELKIPIAAGVIGAEAVIGDFYDLIGGAEGRISAEEITVFKNGGGAHLDLMTAQAVLAAAGGA